MQTAAVTTRDRGAGVPAGANHVRQARGRLPHQRSTAYTYVHGVIKLLASRASSLTQALRRARPEYVLVDGTLAECDRVGDSKAKRHDVNIQAVTGPSGQLLWFSPALPGRVVDITAARTHHIITICERLKIPALADKAYQGAGGTFCTPFKHHRGRELTTAQKAVNRAHSRLRSPSSRPSPTSRPGAFSAEPTAAPTTSRQ